MHAASWQRKGLRSALALLLLVWTALAAEGQISAKAAASSSVKLTIGSAGTSLGGTASIPISVSTEQPIDSYNMEIRYDPEVMEISGIIPAYGDPDASACLESAQGCLLTNYDNTDGWLRAAWIDSTAGEHPITGNQQLFQIQLKADSKAQLGAQALTIDASDPEALTFTGADFSGNEPNLLPVDVTTGTVNVQLPSSGSAADDAQKQDVDVYLDGQRQPKTATAVTADENGRKVTTVQVDNDKVTEQLKSGNMKNLLLPLRGHSSDVIVGQLNGMLAQTLADRSAVLTIQTDRAEYTLPAALLQPAKLAEAAGGNAALGDVQIKVTIAQATSEQIEQARQAAVKAGTTLVTQPLSFRVEADYGGKILPISRFSDYVEHTIALPAGTDPATITTGVLVGDDGRLTHVPTEITQADGVYYATINSMIEGSFSVVSHQASFADTKGSWAAEDVGDLASRLVIQGVAPGRFEPERSITRAEFTAIMLRSLGLSNAGSAAVGSFRDVHDADWWQPDVNAAVQYQLISGYDDDTFRPNAPITRAEAMAVISRAMNLVHLEQASGDTQAGALLSQFSDAAAVGDWARDAVASAVKQGIVQGEDGQIKPGESITRAQSAAMLRRMLVKSAFINP